jgi:predicted O-methyltransferase YrrM
MLKYPDKLKYKTTITDKLRNEIPEISSLVLNRPLKSYLEIGCDLGFTIFSLHNSFEKLLGVDIDPNRIKKANDHLKELELESKISFFLGTSDDLQENYYDVILIDAAHDYQNVMNDFDNICRKNLATNFVVFFHDYGLIDAGVKKFVTDKFEASNLNFCGMKEKWNPLGSIINDWEAVYVVVKQ